jgi:glycerol-3-phosphate acyltransferase PlsY
LPGWVSLFGQSDVFAGLLRVSGLFLLAYLAGSLPTAQLVAWAFGQKDLRSVGSRTVSATGVYYHVSRWLFWPVAAVDILKVAAVTWLGL